MWWSKNHECASSRRSTTLPPFPSFAISTLILRSTVSLLSRTSLVSSAVESVFVVYDLFLSFFLRFVYFPYLFLFRSAHASLFCLLTVRSVCFFPMWTAYAYRFHRKIHANIVAVLFFFNLIACCTYTMLFYFYTTIFYPLFFLQYACIYILSSSYSLLYLPHRVVLLKRHAVVPHSSVSCCLFYLTIPTPCKPRLLSLALCT